MPDKRPKTNTLSPVIRDTKRLASLDSYRIMGTAPETSFDDIAGLAAQFYQTSAAFIIFVDEHHQFFKASVGASEMREALLHSGLCPFTVARGDVLVIPNTLADPLYASNPAVTVVRFYAGVPVRSPEGHVLGTLCVLSTEPQEWNGDKIKALRTFGRQVEMLLALRRLAQESTRLFDAERTTRADSQKALATARRAEGVLSATSDAVVTLDRDFRITYINAEAARLNKKPAEAFLGNLHWEEWPAAKGTEFERQFRRAMTERIAVRFLEHYYVPNEYDQWISVSAYPAADEDGGGLHLVYREVTERIQRERRERFLASLAERARTLTDPEAVIVDAVRSVGEFLEVSRCTFADIDLEADLCTIHLDYCANGIPSMAGVMPLSAFGPFFSAELSEGHAVVVDDVHNDPTRVPPETVSAYEANGIHAFIAVPVVYSARLVSVIAIHSATPRHWKLEKLDLLRTVVERTWLTVQVTREHQEAQRLAEERAHLVAELQEASLRQRQFLREMLAGFTEGRLRLCFNPHELPDILEPLSEPLALSETSLRLLRKQVEAVAEGLNIPKERRADVLTASHEAAMNAVRHGGGSGVARIHGDRRTGRMQTWVQDHGSGIAEEMIHRAVEQGFTTGGFGQGFFLMRSCADRVYLLTGSTGTTVVIEQERHPQEPSWFQ